MTPSLPLIPPTALGWAGCANLTPPGHQCKSRSAITRSLLPIMRLLGDCTIGLGTPLPEEPLSRPAPKVPVPLYGQWSGMAPMLHHPTPGTDSAVICLGSWRETAVWLQSLCQSMYPVPGVLPRDLWTKPPNAVSGIGQIKYAPSAQGSPSCSGSA